MEVHSTLLFAPAALPFIGRARETKRRAAAQKSLFTKGKTMADANQNLGILVGGGPAPGINGVIGAVTLEARTRARKVIGIYDGFQWLMRGDKQHMRELGHDDVSRIHFLGGSILNTARANPTKKGEDLKVKISSGS
jgi:hypothetical protein